jgi:hypothetical protein
MGPVVFLYSAQHYFYSFTVAGHVNSKLNEVIHTNGYYINFSKGNGGKR